jgi:hypothetical protein
MPFDSNALVRQPKPVAADSTLADRPIRCSVCRTPVTSARQRTQRGGGFDHRLVNPAGIRFHVGCFNAAPGCRAPGEATYQHSWFPGYAWKIAVCGGCGAQLGWSYDGAGDAFFGLILDRLRETE